MESTKHLLISIALSLVIFTIGTIGYMLIEGWDLVDSIYMTIITITTVGFGEVHNMSKLGRVFTIGLVFSGVSFFLYVASSMVQFMVEGRIREIMGRRTLNHKIEHLKNHYIVCGYGRIGRVLCKHLNSHPAIKLVVVEKDPEMIPEMESDSMLYISGDASEEENLIKAGIKQARVLIAALATDIDNVFLVLTAKQLNPNIFIVARACEKGAKSKLHAAGANRVESPYDVGAVSMAYRVLRPSVTSFLDLVFAYNRKDIQMEEIPVDPASSLVNIMLKDSGIRQRFNLIIIAIKKPNGEMMFNPSFETVIKSGDTVIAMGKGDNLIEFEKILRPRDRNSGKR
ncbi:MAG: potassium channel protein [Desulfobacteraceae bacterium]|nr:NAD-binding protein [Desulfobacteraceae bacterium]MBC2755100.1 potassium channel protein [Desulfobacteraceae bacterium]